ncbi:MAG: hypothetical protein E7545_06495, partial [Ruminococcaceae bacterium]|nr:hypothetical protein [Oscillospiraceae bacterium]
MKALNLVKSPYTSLAFNIAYAICNCIIGFLNPSWWFITVGAYYTVLAITRFSVLQVKRKANGDYDTELFARRITGILLVLLSFCIIGVNIMSAVKDRGTAFHEIVMIAIATYTFTKITVSIIGICVDNIIYHFALYVKPYVIARIIAVIVNSDRKRLNQLNVFQ